MAVQQWVYVVFLVSLGFGVGFSHRVIINKLLEKPEDVEILGGLEKNNSSSNVDVNVEKYPAFAFKDPLASASDPSPQSANNTIVSTSRSGPIRGSEKWGSNKECCSNNNCESCSNNNCESCKRCQGNCDDCQSCKRCQSSCSDCQTSGPSCGPTCSATCGSTCGPKCGPSCGTWQSRNNPPSITIPGFTVPIRGLKCTPIDCCPGCDCDVVHMYFNHGHHMKKANVQDDVENTKELSDDKKKQDSLPLNDKVKQDSMPISSTSKPSQKSEAENSNVEEIYSTYDNKKHNNNWEEKNVEAMPPMF